PTSRGARTSDAGLIARYQDSWRQVSLKRPGPRPRPPVRGRGASRGIVCQESRYAAFGRDLAVAALRELKAECHTGRDIRPVRWYFGARIGKVRSGIRAHGAP